MMTALSDVRAQSLDVGNSIDAGHGRRFRNSPSCSRRFPSCSTVRRAADRFAIPVIMREWSATREGFAPVVAAALIGMGIGSVFAGYVCDRFGRRPAIIFSVLLFGIATSAIGFSQNLASLAALRFIAGLGIGGALPSSTTIAAELTSARRRTLAVTATIVCVPLGGMLADSMRLCPAAFRLARAVLDRWRASCRSRHPAAGASARIAALPRAPSRTMERVDAIAAPHVGAGPKTAPVFTDVVEQRLERREGIRALFEPERIRDTVALWAAFFLCLLAVYTAFSWLPAMLTERSLDVSIAVSGLTVYNLGGVFGALLCGLAITRMGSRWPMFCAAPEAPPARFFCN